MANIGEITEVINNASKLSLKLASDTHITLQELEFTNAQIVSRRPTTDGKARYYYGVNDIQFDAVLLATTPEIATFNTLTQKTASGGLNSNAYTIVATDKSGATKTIAATSTLPLMRLIKVLRAGFKFRMHFQVTGELVTVT
jgi:hypothetical protein